jgi:hypothetical protein
MSWPGATGRKLVRHPARQSCSRAHAQFVSMRRWSKKVILTASERWLSPTGRPSSLALAPQPPSAHLVPRQRLQLLHRPHHHQLLQVIAGPDGDGGSPEAGAGDGLRTQGGWFGGGGGVGKVGGVERGGPSDTCRGPAETRAETRAHQIEQGRAPPPGHRDAFRPGRPPCSAALLARRTPDCA